MNRLSHTRRRFTIWDLTEQSVERLKIVQKRHRFRLSRDQRPDLGAFIGIIPAVNLAVNQLDLVLREHVHALATRSDWRSRSRAVKRRDLTVLTGTSSTSEISS